MYTISYVHALWAQCAYMNWPFHLANVASTLRRLISCTRNTRAFLRNCTCITIENVLWIKHNLHHASTLCLPLTHRFFANCCANVRVGVLHLSLCDADNGLPVCRR
jgi:hypothetical protein